MMMMISRSSGGVKWNSVIIMKELKQQYKTRRDDRRKTFCPPENFELFRRFFFLLLSDTPYIVIIGVFSPVLKSNNGPTATGTRSRLISDHSLVD